MQYALTYNQASSKTYLEYIQQCKAEQTNNKKKAIQTQKDAL